MATTSIDITASIPIYVPERVDFTGAFPKSREPKMSYVHVANDDGPQWPPTSYSRREKVAIIVATVIGTLAVAMAVLGGMMLP